MRGLSRANGPTAHPGSQAVRGNDGDVLVALEVHQDHVLPADAWIDMRREKVRLHPLPPGLSEAPSAQALYPGYHCCYH